MDGLDWHRDRATLEWMIELGATDCIGDTPIDRYGLDAKPKPKPAAPAQDAVKAPSYAPVPETQTQVDPVAIAQAAAAAASNLDALRDAMSAYTHCALHQGAKNLVFSDGIPGADVMIIGEAPGRDEDMQGKPFVGRAGQLLDKMFACIGLDRGASLYITNILPWRPPQNRDPKPDEVAMMMPFVRRHVELAAPKVLVCMGNHSCGAILGKRGITKLRGKWDQGLGLPVMPMLHPAYLLRQPQAKREAWADLLEIQAKLEQG